MLKAEIHQRAVRCCPQRYLRSWMSPELRGTQPMERGTGAVRSLPDWVILWFSMQLFPLYHLWKGKAVETCTCMGVTFRNFVQPPGKCRQGLWMLPSTKKLKLCCTGVRNWPCITWTECLKQLMHRIIYKYFPGWKILSEGIPCVTKYKNQPAQLSSGVRALSASSPPWGLAMGAQSFRSRAGGCGEISSNDICGKTVGGADLLGGPVLTAMFLCSAPSGEYKKERTCSLGSSWKITKAYSIYKRKNVKVIPLKRSTHYRAHR